MKKNLLYTALGLMGLMGTLAIGVVNAETTITHYTGSNISYTLNGNELFTGVGTITITDGINTITILDRNLGAKKAGTGCDYTTNGGYCPYDETYGYHFQRGNNYGFKPGCDLSGSTYYCSDTITTNAENGQVDATTITYNPAKQKYYNSGVFYKGNNNWLTDNSKVDLWGGSTGGTDTITSTSSLSGDNWKVDESTVKNRQGPCPRGWHVPSIGELNKLVSMMTGLNNSEKVTQLHSDLYIPFAGFRDYYDASVPNMGYNANLWSSSPNSASNPYSRILGLSVDGYLSMNNYSRASALSVRCFYDSYQPFTQSFTLNFTGSEGGSVSTGSIEAEEGNSISRDDEVGNVSISGTVIVTGIADEGYVFSGWLTDCVGDIVTTGCSFTGEFKLNTYTITYKLDGGENNSNNVTGYTIKDIITFENPTKDGYSFDGWFTDAQFTTGVTTIPIGTTGDITIYAKWTENKKPSGGSSGGGGGGGSSKTSDDEKDTKQSTGNQVDSQPAEQASEQASQNDSSVSSGATVDPAKLDEESSNTPMDSSTTSQNDEKIYTPEFQEAYEFAKGKGITTMPTIQQAKIDGKLTRIAMAKMLSYYAINVLGQKPDETRNNKFKDVTDKMDKEYDDGVTLAYQLGIMGINMPNNKFRPNDEVPRAEFATALSRMIYNTSDGEYKSTPKYYIHHMEKLVEEGIITKDDPYMKELRGYVMIMLMRSAK